LIRRECDRLGIPIEVDPGEALLRAVWEAEGNLAFYREQVQLLTYGLEPDDPDGDRLDGPGRGLLQPKMGMSPGRDGQVYVQEYQTHPLVVLYHEAEKWRATVAASALKAGVEERRLQLDQARAAEVFRCVAEALKA